MDPLYNEDGELYAPIRYKELVKDCYSISKNCNTPYSDVVNMTPRERDYLIEFIIEDANKTKEMLENSKKQKA